MAEKKNRPFGRKPWRDDYSLYRCQDCGTAAPCYYETLHGWKPSVCALTMRMCKWRRVSP